MPSIILKSDDDLGRQSNAWILLASVFYMLDTFFVPGVTTMAMNDRVEEFLVNQLHARAASSGQFDFPYVLNTSLNAVV
ncbi:type I methionyl aminopeptidase, partial [Klebsiella pneumoniae]|nr:type I methionyl aminopeptidase [Klebsiella pneumoniae]